MNTLVQKLLLKGKQISLKATVLSLFSFVMAVLVVVLVVQLLYFGKKLSLETVDMKLYGLVKDIKTSIKTNNEINANIVNLLSLMPNRQQPLVYVELLKQNPQLYAAYTGFQNGSFYEIINLNIHETLREIYGAKKTDRWLLINIDGNNPTQKEVVLLDDTLKQTHKRIENNEYNPTKRPWYKAASSTNGIIKTAPYVFSNIPTQGVTYAKEIKNSKEVVAIDVLLYDIQNVLKQHVDSNYMSVYLIGKNNEAVASYSTDEHLLKNFLKEDFSFQNYLQANVLNIKGVDYIVQIAPIDNFKQQEYVVLFAKYDNVVAPYKKQVWYLGFIMFITLLIVVPLVIYFSNIIVRPIYKLVQQSKKVKNREFDNISEVQSPVLEIAVLSSSLQEMSQAIYSYQTSLEEKVKHRTKELRKKNDELYVLSITDKLTGLYNRVHLDHILNEQVERNREYCTVFSIIIMDIDFFKKINDTYGHQVGDTVLVEIAAVLKMVVRGTDTLGRWGGEEFLVVCPQTHIGGAMILAQKINEAIKTYTFKRYSKKVTMSLGVACFKEEFSSVDDIITAADEALYKAKEKGRDQVVVVE
jgi:diguanylate cyclase (GGDEF)-like protein